MKKLFKAVAMILRLKKELAHARKYKALAAEAVELTKKQVGIIRRQREELRKAIELSEQLTVERDGWKARSELVEKSLTEVLTETFEKPFAAFPDLSNN